MRAPAREAASLGEHPEISPCTASSLLCTQRLSATEAGSVHVVYLFLGKTRSKTKQFPLSDIDGVVDPGECF
jgi:hypothetical protein